MFTGHEGEGEWEGLIVCSSPWFHNGCKKQTIRPYSDMGPILIRDACEIVGRQDAAMTISDGIVGPVCIRIGLCTL